MNQFFLMAALCNATMKDFDAEVKRRTIAAVHEIVEKASRKDQYAGNAYMIFSVINNILSTILINILEQIQNKADAQKVVGQMLTSWLECTAQQLRKHGMNVEMVNMDGVDKDVSDLAKKAGLKVETEYEHREGGETIKSFDDAINALKKDKGFMDFLHKQFSI